MAEPKEITYTLAEVAAMTHYPLRALEQGCRRNQFEHSKLGRTRVMTRAQIDALLAKTAQAVSDNSDGDKAKVTDLQRAMARLQRGAA